MTDADRAFRGLRIATAIVAAHRRRDGKAIHELWNTCAVEDMVAVVDALAWLPSILTEELAKALGHTIDLDAYFDHVLKVLAAGDSTS